MEGVEGDLLDPLSFIVGTDQRMFLMFSLLLLVVYVHWVMWKLSFPQACADV